MKEYEFQEIYGEGLIGYLDKVNIINQMIADEEPQLNERMTDMGITLTLDWVFTLFTPNVPIDQTVSLADHSASICEGS